MNEELFHKYTIINQPNVPDGAWVNYAGLITDASLFPNGDNLSGKWINLPPIPDDSCYGTSTEHFAVLSAIDRAINKQQKSFNMIELGAGWGPWVSLAAVVGKNKFDTIELVAVEADDLKFSTLKNHFERNGITSQPNIKSIFLQGAAWHTDTQLKFPRISLHDYGAAASESTSEYRGNNELAWIDVKGYSLDSISSNLEGVIDIAHWDVQGAEYEIASSSVELIQNRFRSIQIGTHSRLIEGLLFKLFHDIKWDILYHQPCIMKYSRSAPSLEAMNQRDGEIYAVNPSLW